MTERRFVWIVLDSVGCGAAPDAAHYGKADVASNTLKHVAQAVHGLHVPNLQRIGLGNIEDIPGVAPNHATPCAYGKMREQSHGKDTTNGHWEFVGVVLEKDLPVYPHGFPAEVMDAFERAIGRKALCNKPMSGTEVIELYGPEHELTKCPIVYTSADSVFQIAAHEDIVPLTLLYEWCEKARSILVGEHGVGRVIARPFQGQSGHYVRTTHRRDYSLNFGRTVLNELADRDIKVVGLGKIHDIYGGSGITDAIHTEGNVDGMHRLIETLGKVRSGLVYINLVDFDSLYGHRNDPVGFARAIEQFDVQLREVLDTLTEHDLLCITADHGCDPTTEGTDHTREWVPLLLWSKLLTGIVPLGDRSTFADLGATLAEYFSVPPIGPGTSMLPLLADCLPSLRA
ncbi:MAG: phosphopentomutase [Alicyclobacillaceae bacterium]|nr:phosphopentomutase [Alicyclobacillaceae bacterium]